MASNAKIIYKYGVTGFVELCKDKATKYSEFYKLYWLKELAILLYTWSFKTENVIKYQAGCIKHKECPNDKYLKKYYESVFDRYPNTIQDIRFYRDAEIVQFLLDMSSALSFLHAHDITHRDIKPSNIAIDKSGRSVLLDFSHAHKMYIPLKKISKHVVTYCYRAPEVFRYQRDGKQMYNEKIDVYSLGMVLLELLTGCNFAEHYVHNVKDMDAGEKIYKKLIKQKEVFANTVTAYFNEHKRIFQYNNKYWELIINMIEHDPDSRPSAAVIYEQVKEFADRNKIHYVEPVNGVLEKRMPDLSIPMLDKNNALYNRCITYAVEIKHINTMEFAIENIHDIIGALIVNGDITEYNYRDVVGALAIIIETVLYDIVDEMDTYGELDNTNVKDAIVLILQKYNYHLFSLGKVFRYV